MSARLPILSATEPASLLPTVAALRALWQEVANKPLWAPPHLWRYLKLRWSLRLDFVDPARLSIAAVAGQVNDCSSCTDICCVGPRSTVLLRFSDIATLIDIGRTDLIAKNKPTFTSEELAGRPALARQVRSQSWRTFPVLRQDSMHACCALTPGGTCSLYPNWPLSCARFPYSLHLDDLEVFYSRRCDSFWVRHDGRADARIAKMVHAAAASYNERIKDAVLLAYASEKLEALGLLSYLST